MSGVGELWVDGQLVASISGVNTAALGNADLARVGLAEVYNCDATKLYADNVVVSETYIGPEISTVNVVLESLDNTLASSNLGYITVDLVSSYGVEPQSSASLFRGYHVYRKF